jgi:hypothetical protein
MTKFKLLLPAVFAFSFLWGQRAEAQSKPVRVFILAGQSNMEGHADVDTFDYIGDDPATAPLLNRCDAQTASRQSATVRGFRTLPLAKKTTSSSPES